ncbi:MAG: MEKHLA domain-containing protein [Thiobacillaceae bacterium]|nr:MEKHLA domain-containing protein [Thiobacillaceae bacterium]
MNTLAIPEPAEDNGWLEAHATLLMRCYRHWLGRGLVEAGLRPESAARALYLAPFVVLSHDATADPLFTYANLAAQRLFEMPWGRIVGLPSRQSAEPVDRAERLRLLERVRRHGYIDDYSGVRVSASGARFLISRATVWNLFDAAEGPCGQAATFSDWTPL